MVAARGEDWIEVWTGLDTFTFICLVLKVTTSDSAEDVKIGRAQLSY